MKIPQCPKKLNHCNQMCPIYKCWALKKHLDEQERQKKQRDSGWD